MWNPEGPNTSVPASHQRAFRVARSERDRVLRRFQEAFVTHQDTAWTAACRRAGIVGLNLRDLRREAGSRLLEGGMPNRYVRRFLDQANLSMTMRDVRTQRRGDARRARRAEECRKRCGAVAQDCDPGLTLMENIAEPQVTETSVVEALTVSYSPNQGAVAKR